MANVFSLLEFHFLCMHVLHRLLAVFNIQCFYDVCLLRLQIGWLASRWKLWIFDVNISFYKEKSESFVVCKIIKQNDKAVENPTFRSCILTLHSWRLEVQIKCKKCMTI